MLESKDHQQIQDSSGVWDLTFASRARELVVSERQIPSTGHRKMADRINPLVTLACGFLHDGPQR
jgi:hypothetical protein